MQDIPDLLDGLRSSINILSAFVMALPENILNRRRGAGFWTVAEHVSHLAQVQPMLLERLRRFMDEDRPEFVPLTSPVTPRKRTSPRRRK
ncbi:MAG: DinB family protein [Desulfobacterales bacterium]